MKIESLMLRLQEAAAAHAQELGFGVEWLREMQCCWVLSNFVLQIARWPAWNETVLLRTWPSGHNRVIATREFIGFDAGGGELFRAGSEWMVLSRRTNRPRNLAKLERRLPGDAEKLISAPQRRGQTPEGYQYVESIRVPYSAIDMNGHANNSEYVRWAMDALRHGFGVGSDVQRLQIAYLAEVFENDGLNLQVSGTGPEQYVVVGRKPKDAAPAFQMEVRY